MEIVKTSGKIILIFFVFATYSDSESNVRNLSCDCSGKNSSDHCPKSLWSILGQNWFDVCQYENNEFCTIKAAVILPENTSYVAALPKVLPALTLAVEEAKRRRILPKGLKFQFSAYDDQCNAVFGQMHAIEAYANNKPHVIFGPSCEYSVAAVARMVRFWNIPLLTAGALTYDFVENKTSCKDNFHLLVRTGNIDFQEISNFILQILHRYNWNKVALMYVKNDYAEISGLHSCKLMMESLVNSLKKANISYNPIDLMAAGGEIKKNLESREFLSVYSVSKSEKVKCVGRGQKWDSGEKLWEVFGSCAGIRGLFKRIFYGVRLRFGQMLTCFVIIGLYLTTLVSGHANDHFRSHFYHVNASVPTLSRYLNRSSWVTGYGKDDRNCLHFLNGNSTSVIPGVVRLAVIAPSDPNHEQALPKILPSIFLAVRAVSHPRTGILPGWDIQVNYRDSNCSSTFGPLAAVEFYINRSVDAFLGPVCDYVIAPVARYSATWGIPVLTAGAQANPFRHKASNFPTLTRMMGSYTLVGEALRHILENYGWKVAGLLYHNHGKEGPLGNSICHFTMAAVFAALNETPVHRSFNQDTYTYYQIKELLQIVAKNSRIVVVCANPNTVREILLAAEELLMVDSGEYVFFNIELFNSMNNDSYTPWFNKNDTFERNERAKKAYTALLTVTAMTPENREYEQFSKEVKELAERNYNYSFGDDSVSTFITAFYDAVILYSLALNESVSKGGSEVNGNDITRRMWNRTFKGITGDVHIDANGDRFADYSLLDMDPETNRFEIVANYIGATRTLQQVDGKKIHWAANREHPPPDTPKCGFDGSLCQTMPEYAILSIILSTLVVIVIVVSVILFRHYKLEAEIASMTWKISIDELIFPNEKRLQGSIMLNMGRRGSQMTVVSYGGISNYEGKQIFIRRALYKGNQVAVKEIQKTRFELTRFLLCELKRMKDIHHDHLVRFYGACITPSQIMFITEYCPKGSLQDILENEQFKLDWMFKFSLMQDIVRGMLYIHNSEIRSHGNLKSSNCLVDARFVLKISDFGLHSLRTPKDLDPLDHEYWKRMLWTAPELLRMENPPLEGTPKGDVYSFGIIVHEMLTRQGPFYLDDINMSPRKIIENVKNGQKPSFRPIVDDLYRDDPSSKDVVALMKKCWGEDPADRPDFSALKNHINKLNKENESGNILDNLLSRMEQYANNLEALVEERTSDYLEEKKKCEELLYQLLPKSVASQLIKGQSVIAETYDQVTIYFSDIVGFTSLSAESTPMQVVDLLNDLYTCFDSIIENFDVYKVETIGDAYMVVSGLPVRNGNLHAREIARMSLALLGQVQDFRIRHRPSTQLKLRIGMHTGPCVAGVVGLKMPRYCLFGDTVNTASRMESNGEALKIHVSPKTKEVLETFKTFELEYRGKVEIKGKGVMSTYWLLGEKKVSTEDHPTDSKGSSENISEAKTAPMPATVVSSPTANNKLANNISNQINNIESKSCNIIPNSSTPLLTNASRDSLV